MIYYGFHNSTLIVQFKKIIINFISIIGLQIVQCLSRTLLEKSIIPHFIWIRWAVATNLKGFFHHLMILNKIFKSFFYPAIICWPVGTGSFKLVSIFSSGKPLTSSHYSFKWFFISNIHWLAFRGTTNWYWQDIRDIRVTFQ